MIIIGIMCRDARRFFCDGCNNFPFKTEVHKCPGTGLETSYETQETRPAPSVNKELPDFSKTKSLGMTERCQNNELNPVYRYRYLFKCALKSYKKIIKNIAMDKE
jgi:hypothetical protein